jgi:uncharacterized protein YcbK (DUF882 family)
MKLRGILRVRARIFACLGLACGVAGVSAITGLSASASGDVRTLSIYNIHTKETVTATYKRDGRFVQDGLNQLNHLMRDWRRNEPTRMDPELIDLIWTIHRDLGSKKPVHLISGYRSPATNAKLRKTRGGQAKKSQHMLGKAADIHLPDVPVKALRNSALVREKGGVGFYPTSGIPFVHVDTANVRAWPRVPRQELALLFPHGKTRHAPASGGALTPADGRKAVAAFRGQSRDKQMETARLLPNVVLASLDMPTRSSQPFVQVADAPRGGAQLASLSGGGLPWFSGDAPADGAPAPAPAAKARAAARFELAASDPVGSISKSARDALERKIFAASVEAAPDFDDDHADSLSYHPIDIAPLMIDRSVSFDNQIAALEHPVQHATAHLFEDLDRPVALALREGLAFAAPAATLHAFSGAAVRNVYADSGSAGTRKRAEAGPALTVASR